MSPLLYQLSYTATPRNRPWNISRSHSRRQTILVCLAWNVLMSVAQADDVVDIEF
jgi:hypothetical protein